MKHQVTKVNAVLAGHKSMAEMQPNLLQHVRSKHKDLAEACKKQCSIAIIW